MKTKHREVEAALASLVAAGRVVMARFVGDEARSCHSIVDSFGVLEAKLVHIAVGAVCEAALEVARDNGPFGEATPASLIAGIKFAVARETKALVQNDVMYFRHGPMGDAKRLAASWFIANAPRWLADLGDVSKDQLAERQKLVDMLTRFAQVDGRANAEILSGNGGAARHLLMEYRKEIAALLREIGVTS